MSQQTQTAPATAAYTRMPPRPTGGQITGFLVLGMVFGLLMAWGMPRLVDHFREPDPFLQQPWIAVAPNGNGVTASLELSGSSIQTPCGSFNIDSRQLETSTTVFFGGLPGVPKDCTGSAADAHRWFVEQLARAETFTPSEFTRVPSHTPVSVTLLDGSGNGLVTLVAAYSFDPSNPVPGGD